MTRRWTATPAKLVKIQPRSPLASVCQLDRLRSSKPAIDVRVIAGAPVTYSLENAKKHRAIRSNQLSMNPGTAFNRLRKALLFDMASKLGINSCFRCAKPIIRIEDWSIDHKEPWLGSDDPEGLFFGLENIAFSHSICNIRAGRKPNKVYESATARSTAWWRKARLDRERRDRDNERRRERRAAVKNGPVAQQERVPVS